MNIGELFRTKRWKTFMGYIYGWGAAIVMIGALFKLQHWNYSGLFLTIGLVTEAFIFFLSAFEPTLEVPEWSKVHPELRDDYEIIDFDEIKPKTNKGISELFSSTELTPELLDQVGRGLNELSLTAKGMKDISSATFATEMYVKNLGSASEAMGAFSEINNRANESINSSVEVLVDSYSTAQQLTQSGKSAMEKMHKSGEEFTAKLSETSKQLAKTYDVSSVSLSNDIKNIGESSKKYTSSLGKLNGNIDILNTSFESQLKGTEEQFKASQKFSTDLTNMNEVLNSSVDELKKYKENAEQLNKHLEALNTIYGNMLGAMSYRK